MRRLIIAGARGSGLKALEVAEALDYWDEIIFVDDNEELWGSSYYGRKVCDLLSVDPEFNHEYEAVCPIGNSRNRLRMVGRLQEHLKVEFPNVIHPSAQVSKHATLSKGNLISQNVVIQPGAQVGMFNTFNVGAVVGPLARVWNWCTINAHTKIASEAVVEDNCYIGMGALIKQRVTVATRTTVGANTFVNKVFTAGVTLVGTPARILER